LRSLVHDSYRSDLTEKYDTAPAQQNNTQR
jgi:hypothetical protein